MLTQSQKLRITFTLLPKLDFVSDNNFFWEGEKGGVVLVVSLKQSQMRNLGSLCFVCYWHHNEIISTRNLLWCTLLDVFWENNLVLIKSICCFDIWSWKFSAPLRVYSAFCTSEWEILKLTFPLENDSSDVSEKNWIREQHKSQDFFMLQSDFYDNYWWTLSLWHQLSILLSRLDSQFSLLAALYFLVNVWQEFGLWSR